MRDTNEDELQLEDPDQRFKVLSMSARNFSIETSLFDFKTDKNGNVWGQNYPIHKLWG